MGAWISSADEVDATKLDVRCRVNAELRQDANTSELILMPRRCVGIGFDPPHFLARGDQVAIEITGLGRLVNRVV